MTFQIFLIEYLDDTLEVSSHALPLPEIGDPIIDGRGLAVIKHSQGVSHHHRRSGVDHLGHVQCPGSEPIEASKLPIGSTVLVAAGFRQKRGQTDWSSPKSRLD